MRASILAALLAALAGPAAAHPHAYVDQQALLSVGPDGAEVRLVIVPSAAEGPAILAHLDGDGDGFVSDAEAEAFGAEVLAETELRVDGEPLPLILADAKVADPAAVAAGIGAIEVTAEASFGSLGPGAHRVDFAVSHGSFSHGWFVQPFLGRDLAKAGAPVVERSEDGARASVAFTLPVR